MPKTKSFTYGRAQVDLQRLEDVVERDVERLGPLAVDLDDELRVVGGEARRRCRGGSGPGCPSPSDRRSAPARVSIFGSPVWSSISNWKPPKLPTPWIAGGANGITKAPATPMSGPRRRSTMSTARPARLLPLSHGMSEQKIDALVRPAAEEREAGDGEACSGSPGRAASVSSTAAHRVGRDLEARALGPLHDDDEVALVLLRHEAAARA